MTFNALVKRTVFLVNEETAEREKITVAVSAPYRPAKSTAMSDHAACLVQFYEEIDDSGFEVFGADEFEALDNALQHVKLLLEGMATKGVVQMPDGKPYAEGSKSQFGVAQASMSQKVLKRLLGDRGK